MGLTDLVIIKIGMDLSHTRTHSHSTVCLHSSADCKYSNNDSYPLAHILLVYSYFSSLLVKLCKVFELESWCGSA